MFGSKKHQGVSYLFFQFFKIILPHPTKRANPIVWDIVKRSAGQNAAIRITFIRVINPITNCTNILLHKLFIKWFPDITIRTDYCSSVSRCINSSIPSEAPFCITCTFLPEAIGTSFGSIRYTGTCAGT